MKVYYNFNLNPFCVKCLDVMMVNRNHGKRDENGAIKSIAFCLNKQCAQFNQQFIIPPLSAETVPAENA